MSFHNQVCNSHDCQVTDVGDNGYLTRSSLRLHCVCSLLKMPTIHQPHDESLFTKPAFWCFKQIHICRKYLIIVIMMLSLADKALILWQRLEHRPTAHSPVTTKGGKAKWGGKERSPWPLCSSATGHTALRTQPFLIPRVFHIPLPISSQLPGHSLLCCIFLSDENSLRNHDLSVAHWIYGTGTQEGLAPPRNKTVGAE